MIYLETIFALTMAVLGADLEFCLLLDLTLQLVLKESLVLAHFAESHNDFVLWGLLVGSVV